jgi:nucleotidyltransferase/DNA polymerase involved in DNA repair
MVVIVVPVPGVAYRSVSTQINTSLKGPVKDFLAKLSFDKSRVTNCRRIYFLS